MVQKQFISAKKSTIYLKYPFTKITKKAQKVKKSSNYKTSLQEKHQKNK
jgi:hypothetical protein